MTPMIEKVARAICRVDLLAIAMEEGITLSPNGLQASIDKEWHRAVPNARAAISAMSDPTEQMVEASIFLTGTDVYDAMISAALEESDHQPDMEGEDR